ncbi:MAG: hypothetical protein MZU97_26705 [Bacillus subtilis]|nr:hypothetical protein [Bacillus subtilis]
MKTFNSKNTALVNNPAILTDYNLPRIALGMRQGLGQRWARGRYKSLIASSLDISKAMNGIGFTAELDIGYNLGFLDETFGTNNLFNINGNIFGGYYLVDSNGGLTNNLFNVSTTGTTLQDPAVVIPTTADQGDEAQGFYAGINQEIYNGIGAVWKLRPKRHRTNFSLA